MQSRMTAMIVGALTFTGAWMMDSSIGMQLWWLGLVCYVMLVGLVVVDTRNLLSLSTLRMLPMLVFTVYVGVFALGTNLLEAHFSPLMSIYLSALNVLLADYLGQMTMGAELVTLMGRDHLGRPGRKMRRETANF